MTEVLKVRYSLNVENTLILYKITVLNLAFAESGTTMSSILVKFTFSESKYLSFSVTFAYFITLLLRSNASGGQCI